MKIDRLHDEATDASASVAFQMLKQQLKEQAHHGCFTFDEKDVRIDEWTHDGELWTVAGSWPKPRTA